MAAVPLGDVVQDGHAGAGQMGDPGEVDGRRPGATAAAVQQLARVIRPVRDVIVPEPMVGVGSGSSDR